jgi:hypothetical protein
MYMSLITPAPTLWDDEQPTASRNRKPVIKGRELDTAQMMTVEAEYQDWSASILLA